MQKNLTKQTCIRKPGIYTVRLFDRTLIGNATFRKSYFRWKIIIDGVSIWAHENECEIYSGGTPPKVAVLSEYTGKKFYSNGTDCVFHRGIMEISRVEERDANYSIVFKTPNAAKLITKGQLDNFASRFLKEEDIPYYEKFSKVRFSNHHFTMGHDPEIFVESDKLIPAWKFLPSKKNKLRFNDFKSVDVYWDGFAAEFAQPGVYECLGWTGDCIAAGLFSVINRARKFDKNAKLSLKTTVDIEEELLYTSEDEQVEFGCVPSLNAYGLKGIRLSGREVPYRSAGGHIHFGIGKQKNPDKLVKELDRILGICAVAGLGFLDDKRRRMMYGLPGEYRLPDHGLEYRVLSNGWVFHPLAYNAIFELARLVVNYYRQLGHIDSWIAPDESEIIRIIIENDIDAAKEIVKQNKNFFAVIVDSVVSTRGMAMFELFSKGFDKFVEFKSVEQNWKEQNYIHHVGMPWGSLNATRGRICAGEFIPSK